MSAKKLLILCAVLIVGLMYYYLYHDSFVKRDIPIQFMFRPDPRKARGPAGPENDSIGFVLSKEYKLTSVEVLPLDDLATNKYAHPTWHLVSDSNSVPVATFAYGGRIRGMHSEVKDLVADPLQPSTGYRIVIKAGSVRGEHDFKTPASLVGSP